MKILIVDDDRGTRLSLTALVQKMGFHVLEAADGPSAIETFKSHPDIEIILLDWILPGMQGPTVCKTLKSISEAGSDATKPRKGISPYVIMLTIRDEAGDAAEGLMAGADDYVRKPYDPIELEARIEVGKRFLDLGRKKEDFDKLAGALMMAGAVSHEFNQPVQVLAGYIELLLAASTLDADDREMVVSMREAVEKIKALSKKLISVSGFRTREYISGGPEIFDLGPFSK